PAGHRQRTPVEGRRREGPRSTLRRAGTTHPRGRRAVGRVGVGDGPASPIRLRPSSPVETNGPTHRPTPGDAGRWSGGTVARWSRYVRSVALALLVGDELVHRHRAGGMIILVEKVEALDADQDRVDDRVLVVPVAEDRQIAGI